MIPKESNNILFLDLKLKSLNKHIGISFHHNVYEQQFLNLKSYANLYELIHYVINMKYNRYFYNIINSSICMFVLVVE